MRRDVQVEVGDLLGDNAVLVIEARNGIGWNACGAVLLTHERETWARAGDHAVSYPAGD